MIVHGNIGSASANAAIHADNFIKTLTANAIWADITAEDTVNAMDGNIWNFSVLTGDFTGSIRAGNLARSGEFGGACEVQGNWNASVTLGGQISAPIIVHGNITPESTWDVAQALVTGTNVGGDPRAGAVTVAGDFQGTMAIGWSVRGPITIGGDLGSGASIIITSKIESGTTSEYAGSLTVSGQLLGTVTMGDQLQGPITIENDGEEPAGALVGQIVINASDTSYTWDDEVTIGTTSPILLGPNETGDGEAPYYGVFKASIGGGAVGVVPFNFHRNDSTPDHDSIVTTGALSTVTLEHYGPVLPGTSPDVRV